VTVAETEYKIRPAADRVAGTGAITIVVHNNGKIVHALAIKTPQGVEQTPAIQPGGSATLTFHITQPGSYTFYCPIDHHRKLGMVGTLTVRKGGPSSGGAPIGPTTSSSTSSVHGGY
jgi:plastocyanin